MVFSPRARPRLGLGSRPRGLGLGLHVPIGTHCPCQGICHTWHARLTRRPCRLPAHVPRVARTPHPPPSAWRMCRAWHVRRALRRPPGARATFHRTRRPSPCFCAMRGFTPRAPPVCHAWHMAITPLTTRGTCVNEKRCHTWLGISNSCATRGRGSHTWRLTTCHLWHLSIRLMPRVVHFEKN